jgi:AcrR family transcriptional regulator
VPKVSPSYLEARRQDIIAAASTVFCRKGLQAATMAEIAEEAGITAGAIYRYFHSKDELAFGCLSESAREVTDQWLTTPPHTASPLADFEALAQSTYGLLNDPLHRSETILSLESILNIAREGDPEAMALAAAEQRRIAGGIAAWIATAQQAGELAPDIDPQPLARALLAGYWGARIARLVDPEADTDAQLAEIAKLLRHSAR